MAGWGILFLLIVLGFSAVVIIKLVPVYLESYKIEKAMRGALEDPEVINQSRRDIILALTRRLDIDGVTRINYSNFADYGTVTIDKDARKVTMEIFYQSEVPLFGNLTLLADFEKFASN